MFSVLQTVIQQMCLNHQPRAEHSSRCLGHTDSHLTAFLEHLGQQNQRRRSGTLFWETRVGEVATSPDSKELSALALYCARSAAPREPGRKFARTRFMVRPISNLGTDTKTMQPLGGQAKVLNNRLELREKNQLK